LEVANVSHKSYDRVKEMRVVKKEEGRQMTLQQLKYVAAVAEKGTISEAAKALFISQPSLTNAIKELESEMQITIFNRTNKGIVVSNEGDEFLSYARQVLEQANLLEEKFLSVKKQSPRFSVSAQHYSFAVNAFVDVIREFGGEQYDFTLRETQTYEIMEDVSRLKSEIGILYTSSKNEEVIKKLLRQNNLEFEELFVAKPHIFISSKHPLAPKEVITLEELEEYPYLSFEQGDYNSFYFSEEILSTVDRSKNIKVRDRATLFNLAVGLNGYTVSTGVISKELNGENIIARPLRVQEFMRVGTIKQKNMPLSRYGKAYMESLKKHVQDYTSR
jgi:DNA-binding transcriptional LysR family regulator